MTEPQRWFVKDLVVTSNPYDHGWPEHKLSLSGPEGPVEIRWFGKALLAPAPGTIVEVRSDST